MAVTESESIAIEALERIANETVPGDAEFAAWLAREALNETRRARLLEP